MCIIIESPNLSYIVDSPIVIRNFFTNPSYINEDSFLKSFGHFSQIKKDLMVRHRGETTGFELLNEMKKTPSSILFFTNEYENPLFINSLKTLLPSVPEIQMNNKKFAFSSVSVNGSSHPFHAHGKTWNYMIYGEKRWYFTKNKKHNNGHNMCLTHKNFDMSCIQKSNDLIIFPENMTHGTCNLNNFSVSIGYQEGKPSTDYKVSTLAFENISSYYDNLEANTKRNKEINSLSVHRFLGKDRLTTIHYDMVYYYMVEKGNITKILDAGCGIGGAMIYLSSKEKKWYFEGFTLSTAQYKTFSDLNDKSNIKMHVRSFDSINSMYSNIYSIEALIHTSNLENTIKIFSQHLEKGGRLILIDDYVSNKYNGFEKELVAFKETWMANSLVNVSYIKDVCIKNNLKLFEKINLGQQYEINKYNYNNQKVNIKNRKVHQGFLAGDLRRNLYIDNILQYWLLVFEKL